MSKRLLLYLTLYSLTIGLVQAEAPQLSIPHGIYREAFRLYITSPVPGTTLYFTDDGSDPREKGQLYDGSLSISNTTVIRSAFLIGDSVWSDVATASYIFPQSLLTQGNKPYGYPQYWGKYCQITGTAIADYEMDPEITGNKTYSTYVTEGITTLPIVSLVTERDNLFSRENDSITGGIYIFTGCPVGDGTGRGWERPVSFEMIGGQDDHDLTIDCCLKLHGGHGRLPEKNPKHAFRLHFKSAYGPKKLKYPVFGDRAPRRFNALVLRTFFGYSWTHWDNAQRSKAQYARDLWARETQAKLGEPISTGQYVHLFINGLYWGMYNLCERITGDFCAEHFGGAEEDWDVTEVDGGAGQYHAAIPTYGTIDAWNQMADLIYELPNHKSYMHLVGCGSDGKPNVKYPPLLDVDNFIHYMLINLYGGNTDWDHHNWYAFRNRILGDNGFRFLCWDTENIFISPTEDLTSKNNRGCPTGFLNRLMKQGIFAHRFHELAQQALTHGGPLSPEGALATWDSLYHVIELALWDEAARWGDYRRDVHPYQSKGSLYKPDVAYQTERTRLLKLYFPVRTDNFIQQLRDRGWFPTVEAPAIFIDETEVGYGIQPLHTESRLTMTGRNIYYTLDGSAPVNWFNNDAGALSPTAIAYTDGENVMEQAASWALPDTITLRAICNDGGEWSPIVTVRLAIDNPDIVRNLKDQKASEGLAYDLLGRRITARDLRQGIFIVGGKKRIIR
ncbi:MAG: CotH kinase family protein [Bacteroidaceae bacterium]|nr:CotH kinase family protein [Bacteroidaceae bacterium]